MRFLATTSAPTAGADSGDTGGGKVASPTNELNDATNKAKADKAKKPAAPAKAAAPVKTAGAAAEGYYEISQILYVPNRHSPILSCDITRAAFVTKTYTLTFSDGVLTGSSITKPSEVLGFMSIPLDIAKAVVAVPGSIVKFNIDTTTQSTALIAAQKDLIAAQEARIRALQSLEKTKQGDSKYDAPR